MTFYAEHKKSSRTCAVRDELCFQNTLDQLKIQGADSLCIIHVTTQSEYNSSVPPKSPVERSEWI